MNLLDVVLLMLAGFAAGAINAVAGGGTFVSFGALTLVGLPPIIANATSAVAVLPGYASSALAYRRELFSVGRKVWPIVVLQAAGSLAGALLLLSLANATFADIVPWLLLAATGLFAFGPQITGWLKTRSISLPKPLAYVLHGIVGIYGGFFGGGMGIMVLALLGMTEASNDYHRINAIKTLTAVAVALVTLVVFTGGGAVAWSAAVPTAVAVAAGGWGGVALARRLPQWTVRAVVIAIGLFLSAYYAVQ